MREESAGMILSGTSLSLLNVNSYKGNIIPGMGSMIKASTVVKDFNYGEEDPLLLQKVEIKVEQTLHGLVIFSQIEHNTVL